MQLVFVANVSERDQPRFLTGVENIGGWVGGGGEGVLGALQNLIGDLSQCMSLTKLKFVILLKVNFFTHIFEGF